VIDADDPIGYREAKHYTRHFYRSVAKLFADSSVMVVQLPSPLTFPDSHANALATLRAAGLDVVPYRAALPALGEWGFALASPKSSSVELSERVLAARHRLPPGLRYVTAVNLDGLFALPRDVKGEDGAVSTLGAPTIVELYARENALR
jgi:spermidine synthase